MRRKFMDLRGQSVGRLTATGALWAVVVIPFLPIILPLILLFYFGQIIGILRRGEK